MQRARARQTVSQSVSQAESGFNCGGPEEENNKASDGFAEAGAAVRALMPGSQQEQPQQHVIPR